MEIFKATFKLLIGGVFGIAATFALSPAFAAFVKDDGSVLLAIVFGVTLISAALGMFTPTVRRAFGRGFLILGASVFALPISAFLLSGRAASEVVYAAEEVSEALAAVGAGLAGIALTGVATFVGVILGTILLLAGLILALGGRREVVVIERKPAHGQKR